MRRIRAHRGEQSRGGVDDWEAWMNKKRQDGDICRQMHACRKLRLLLIIMMADDKDDDRETQKRERD